MLNDKIYIGAHSTNDLDDEYYGSGKHIRRSIKKYGLTNFKKEIMHIFDNAEEMYKTEAIYVNEEFILNTNTYNMKVGGMGGWDHINAKKMTDETKKKISDSMKSREFTEEHKEKLRGPKTEEHRANMRKPKSEAHLEKMRRPCSETTKKKISIANTGKILSEEQRKNLSDALKGKKASIKTREKMSTSHKGKIVSAETKDRLSGKNNGNYGTICITDGYNNSRILKEACIPDGWYAGRTVSVETKEKMSLGIRKEKHPAYGKMWINNCITNKLIHKETIIPDGWHKGMITNS
jgi:hypothetical protein